jgi:ribonuclease R
VEALRDCARALQAFRRRRGFLTLDLVEPRINFNERGFVEGFKVAPRHEAHEMVEEAMLAANEAVAAHCIAEGIPALYRIHAPPPEYGLERFEAQSALLGAPLGLLAPRGKGEGERSPKQPPKAVKVHQLSRYLKHNERHPHAELLSSLLLRAMSKALYEPEPGLHFGLGTRTYLHFTSPIRRYPDLWVHRQLKAWLRAQGPERQSGQQGRAALPSEEDAREVAAHSSRRERLIMDAERRVLDAYKALYMKDHLGEEYEGFVCQTSPKGCMVELNDLPVWCSLDEEALPGFEYDEERFTWHNARTRRRVALGTPLRVLIAEVSVLEGRVGARIVEG